MTNLPCWQFAELASSLPLPHSLPCSTHSVIINTSFLSASFVLHHFRREWLESSGIASSYLHRRSTSIPAIRIPERRPAAFGATRQHGQRLRSSHRRGAGQLQRPRAQRLNGQSGRRTSEETRPQWCANPEPPSLEYSRQTGGERDRFPT